MYYRANIAFYSVHYLFVSVSLEEIAIHQEDKISISGDGGGRACGHRREGTARLSVILDAKL